jgi:integrase
MSRGGAEKEKRAARERDETFTGAFTDRWVRHTPSMSKEVQYAERLIKGRSLMLYVTPSGTKTWRVLYYNNRGGARSERLGQYPTLSVADARKQALDFPTETAEASAKAGTLKKVAENWFTDWVEKNNFASKSEIRRHLDKYILPELGHLMMFKVGPDDIGDMLRKIENNKIRFKKRGKSLRRTNNGRSQADAVLATLRSMMNWYSGVTNGKFKPIATKALKRDPRKTRDKRRQRALDFDERRQGRVVIHKWNDRGEIRAVWKACEHLGYYGAMVKLLLLTAQRLEDVAEMKWADISDDGVWIIRVRPGPNPKGTAGEIKLPQTALDILFGDDSGEGGLPKVDGNEYVFPAAKRRNKPFNSFSQHKRELDDLIGSAVRPWTHHDLRRTARSLMSKAGVLRDISERVLGHTTQGVEAVYDVYDFTPEKNAAVQKLADEIGFILDPKSRPDNVVPIDRRPRNARQ